MKSLASSKALMIPLCKHTYLNFPCLDYHCVCYKLAAEYMLICCSVEYILVMKCIKSDFRSHISFSSSSPPPPQRWHLKTLLLYFNVSWLEFRLTLKFNCWKRIQKKYENWYAVNIKLLFYLLFTTYNRYSKMCSG